MHSLYAYSLIPVVAISLLLFFTVVLRHRGPWGLASYCGATALWGLNLLFAFSPSQSLSDFGLRMSAAGAFVVAGYLHAAYDLTDQKHYGLLWVAYLAALTITIAGVAFPGLLYDPVSLAAGPMFWPAMALAMTASMVPFWHLARAYLDADEHKKMRLQYLFAAGFVGYAGAWTNAVMLAHDHLLPYGLFFVLASLLILARVVQLMESGAQRRIFERSLLYSALTAFLSALFLFAALLFLADTTEPVLRDYGLSAFFLLAMAALAFEPVRQQLQEVLGRTLSRDKAQASDLAKALAEQEERAHQAHRLAELGTFTSAIAHEVRNPLGVLTANLALLERSGADTEIVDDMRRQIDRASHFLDDLLDYGRPSPLELRMVSVADTVELARSSATTALSDEAPGGVRWHLDIDADDSTIEADQSQLLQVFVILFENALLALTDSDSPEIAVTTDAGDDTIAVEVADSGPGIDDAVADTLFEPFVTSRKREGKSQGTGLGLAIARNIIERHGGHIELTDHHLGGACFKFELPRHQKVLAAATASRNPSPA